MKNQIIIADNTELVRRGLKAILKDLKTKYTLLEASDSKQLFEVLKKNDQSIVLIDYTTTGFSITDIMQLKNNYSKLKIVAITPYINAKTIIQAIKSGVDSHIKKECSAMEIIESIEETFKGNKFYCAGIIDQMREESINLNDVDLKDITFDTVSLTDRELQIVGLIAEGYTNSQIAAVLYISNHTVNTHRKNIMKKLGVNNTAGIVMYAVKTDLVSPDQFTFNSSN